MPETEQNPVKPEQNLPHDKEGKRLSGDISDVVTSTLRYANERMALVATEAKIALNSLIIIAILAGMALILLASIWALLCFALLNYLLVHQIMATAGAVMVIAGANLLALITIGLIIKPLTKAIGFQHSLSDLDNVAENDI